MITFRPGSLALMGELLLSCSIFAWCCPQKRNFYFRLIPTILILLTLSFFYPFVNGWNFYFTSMIRMVLFIISTYAGVRFCFNIKPFAALTIVASGIAIQHIGNQIYLFFRYLPMNDFSTFLDQYALVFEPVFVFASAVVGFFVFGISYWKNKFYEQYEKSLSIIAFSVIFICLFIERLIRLIPGYNNAKSLASYTFCALCCVLALAIEFTIWKISTLNTKNAVLSTLLKEEKKHFEETKQMMTTINKRGHDLKHLLEDFGDNVPSKYIDSVKQEVRLYEERYITSNPSLDVLLTNLNYKYSLKNIKLKLVGDTGLLSFMDEMDMIMLFDNGLNNAINAALKVDEEKRTIQIILEEKGNMINLLFLNYFNEEIDGIPDKKTTPKNYEHGIGLSSIKEIARKYDGDINIYTNGNKFHLNVYLFNNKH